MVHVRTLTESPSPNSSSISRQAGRETASPHASEGHKYAVNKLSIWKDLWNDLIWASISSGLLPADGRNLEHLSAMQRILQCPPTRALAFERTRSSVPATEHFGLPMHSMPRLVAEQSTLSFLPSEWIDKQGTEGNSNRYANGDFDHRISSVQHGWTRAPIRTCFARVQVVGSILTAAGEFVSSPYSVGQTA